jgi:RNA polymerase sigma-70 factor (ECF subfamily)
MEIMRPDWLKPELSTEGALSVRPIFAELRSEGWLHSREQAEAKALHEEVTKIFEDARDDVFRYLITLGLHPPQAQDATQEVFLRLYVEMKKGEEIRNKRAWIFRVAHNYGLQIRAREAVFRPFDPDLEDKLRDRDQSPEFSMLERERMLRLHSAVESLSPQQRQCLQLRAQGLRYREIASAIGIGVSTVSEFLQRAILRLRKAAHE